MLMGSINENPPQDRDPGEGGSRVGMRLQELAAAADHAKAEQTNPE